MARLTVEISWELSEGLPRTSLLVNYAQSRGAYNYQCRVLLPEVSTKGITANELKC